MDILTIILLLLCGGMAAGLFVAAKESAPDESPEQVFLAPGERMPARNRYPADFSRN